MTNLLYLCNGLLGSVIAVRARPCYQADMKNIKFDENGVEQPQGKIFGIIPYYSNRFAPDGTFKGWIKPYLYVLPIAIFLGLSAYFAD